MAAASAARHLPEEDRNRLVLQFLDDDYGVRKCGLRAVPTRATPEVRAKVEQLSRAEDDPTLRDL